MTLTKEELIRRLGELARDIRQAPYYAGSFMDYHQKADALLTQFINDPDITEAYERIDRWHA